MQSATTISIWQRVNGSRGEGKLYAGKGKASGMLWLELVGMGKIAHLELGILCYWSGEHIWVSWVHPELKVGVLDREAGVPWPRPDCSKPITVKLLVWSLGLVATEVMGQSSTIVYFQATVCIFNLIAVFMLNFLLAKQTQNTDPVNSTCSKLNSSFSWNLPTSMHLIKTINSGVDLFLPVAYNPYLVDHQFIPILHL